MASAANFPIFFPSDARRAFGSEELVRRLARIAGWGSGARVLELGSGSAPSTLVLAKELGCTVTVADPDQAALARVQEKARAEGLERVQVLHVDLSQLRFEEGQFDGIFLLGPMLWPLDVAAQKLRPFLAAKGRIALTYPVRVGRHPASVVLEHFERQLGAPMLLPRDCLQILERAGFEPETVETLSSAELDDFYKALEPHVAIDEPAKAIREEMDLHRTAGGRGSFSYGLVLGRRREPGEKPPVSRNE